MSALCDFLLTRIAEDEAVARAAAGGGHWHFADSRDVGAWTLYDETWRIADLVTYPRAEQDYKERYPGSRNRPPYYVDADANGAHIARHDPGRVLAECEAKRRIVTDIGVVVQEPFGVQWPEGYKEALEYTLRLLALPYADHPEYREDWKP